MILNDINETVVQPGVERGNQGGAEANSPEAGSNFIDGFLSRLTGVRSSNTGWMAHCPSHNDENPSLAITLGDDGRILLKCMSGCATKDVVASMGLGLKDLFDPHSKARSTRFGHKQATALYETLDQAIQATAHQLRAEVVSKYDYPDNFSVVRFKTEPKKTFRPYYRAADGWALGDPKGKLPLFRRDEIKSEQTVYVGEGEKCCLIMTVLGLAATTSAHGASSAGRSDWTPLSGKDVILVPDNDPAGEKYISDVAEQLSGVSKSIKVIRLKDLFSAIPEGGDIEQYVMDRAERGVEPGAIRSEIEALVQSARPTTMEKHVEIDLHDCHFTDLGNAKRLVREHGAELRFCHEWGKFLTWSGSHWVVDNGEAMRLAKRTVLKIYAEAAQYRPQDGATSEERKLIEAKREAVTRHALRSESDNALFSMLKLTETEEGVSIKAERLDADPMLFNVKNGTIDLRTGNLRPHNKSDYLSKMVDIIYDPKAEAPQWKAFLELVTAGNKELEDYLQVSVGYAMTGLTSEQQLSFLYGSGSNGKSTFVGPIEKLLGPYVQKAPRSLLESKQSGDGVPCDVARLQGARLVICNEIDEGKRLAEATVKDLTGGDRLVARFMRQDFFEFAPTHKLWMYGNHRPVITGSDDGIWRRIHLVPFTVTIPDNKKDPHFKEKLLTELPGILNWALAGCLWWQKQRLRPPPIVVDAVKEYRMDSDTIASFLDECCALEPGAWTDSRQLLQAYQRWQAAEGVKSVYITGQKALTNKLKDRGLSPHKYQGQRGWRGIRLRDAPDGSDSTCRIRSDSNKSETSCETPVRTVQVDTLDRSGTVFPLNSIEKSLRRNQPENHVRTVRTVHATSGSTAGDVCSSDASAAVNDLDWSSPEAQV